MSVFVALAYSGNDGFTVIGTSSCEPSAWDNVAEWCRGNVEDFPEDLRGAEEVREWLSDNDCGEEVTVEELSDVMFTPEGSGTDFPKFCRHGREGATYWEVSPGVFNVLPGGAGYADLEGLMRLRGDRVD